MILYDGGSDRDNILSELTGNYTLPQPSSGNQMFISFINNGTGTGKGFSGSIKFGTYIYTYLLSFESVFSLVMLLSTCSLESESWLFQKNRV